MTDDMIRGLDDAGAVRVLTTFARARLRAGGGAETETETEWTPEIERALRQEFPAEVEAAAGSGTVSEGDLARQALLLLADDPRNREPLAALIENPPPPSFGFVTAVAVTTAALVALQTEVRFERKDGKVHLKISKKAAGEGLLKSFVEMLTRFRPPS